MDLQILEGLISGAGSSLVLHFPGGLEPISETAVASAGIIWALELRAQIFLLFWVILERCLTFLSTNFLNSRMDDEK